MPQEKGAAVGSGSILFSILIPVRNDRENLFNCLAHLERSDLKDCEVLVCDDGSDPPLTSSDLRINISLLRVFRLSGQGPAAARNFLAGQARGRYLFFLDADTQPLPDTLACARRIISENPGMEAFFGSYDDAPSHPSLVSKYKNLQHNYIHQQSGREVSTFWCGCGVILRRLFLASGGLSESYRRPSIEDIELGMRLSRKGTAIHVFPQLQVKHMKRWTYRTWLSTDLLRRGIPWVRLMRFNREFASQLNFTWTQHVAALAGVGFLATLLAAALWPRALLMAPLPFALFFFLNYGFFRLMARTSGWTVAARVIPLHLVYALVCVISVAAGLFSPPLKLKYRSGSLNTQVRG